MICTNVCLGDETVLDLSTVVTPTIQQDNNQIERLVTCHLAVTKYYPGLLLALHYQMPRILLPHTSAVERVLHSFASSLPSPPCIWI